jgi:hypothetical protein
MQLIDWSLPAEEKEREQLLKSFFEVKLKNNFDYLINCQ